MLELDQLRSTGRRPRGGVSPAVGPLNLIDVVGLGVFALGRDFAVYRRLQVLPDDAWSGWESLGGSLDDTPASVLSAGAVNYLFGVDLTGLLQENSDVTGGWAAHPGGSILTGTPAVGSSADGRLEIFVVTNGGTLEHQWQVDGGWFPWFSHENPPEATVYDVPAVASAVDGRLELFVVSADLALTTSGRSPQ